ncbi:hypothetical protein Tco_0612569 [Tanacetum coccineum]
MAEEEEQERGGDLGETNTIAYIEERRDTPLLERKDITYVKFLIKNEEEIFTDAGDGVKIILDGVASPAM